MGKVEEIVKRTSRKEFVKAAVLGSIQVAGVISVALVAPNALGALKKLGLMPRDKEYAVKRSLGRLISSGHVGVESKNNKKYFILTKKGKAFIARLEAKNFRVKKPKRWDGKFRILIFDVAEKRRNRRDSFRILLRQIGFKPIQQSVWAYPYDCEDIIQLLKTEAGIGKDVIYLVTGDIENKQKLIDLFDLGR